ncbi:hypothetical protein LPB137_00830 [Poseidonibacter parvus]|uniref:Uncharacterized protein n=1 Tax=Poseidonibacter parvus TaxID=1850254 RepID=A0A1P8KIU9_9BACT|nr:hypothetical protein [Poseidonibacter parvus]APW64481.1 hypothetical protein LPB137_00830 [Poseidonibacter parvus]
MKKATILILIKLFLFTLFVNANLLEEKKLNLNPEIVEEKYQLEDRYDKPVELPSEIRKKDSAINLDVDVDKEKKQIDRLKLDVDKKF